MRMYDFYMQEVQSQYPATLDMIAGGWHIDVPALLATRRQFAREISDLNAELQRSAGWVPKHQIVRRHEKF